MFKTLTIAEVNLQNLLDLVNKLNKAAKRLGLTDYMTVTTSNPHFLEVEDGAVKMFDVTITGNNPNLGDWIFVATLQHLEAENIIRRVPGVYADKPLPERFRHTGRECEVCKLARNRVDTYVLYSPNTNEYKQVGKTCLATFTGVQDAVKYAELLAKAEVLFADVEKAENDAELDGTGCGRYPSGERYFPIDGFLDFVAKVVREEGYVGRTAAREMCRPATADLAWNLYRKASDKTQPEACDFVKAGAALKWIREVYQPEGNNEYGRNMKVLCNETHVSYRNAGYVASLISMYNRDIEETARVERVIRERAESNFIGKVGEKLTVALKVTGQTNFSSQYGTTYLYKMADKNGNVVVWMASSYNDALEANLTDNKNGKETFLNVTGTVKEHKVYQNTKQTVLTRCKLS